MKIYKYQLELADTQLVEMPANAKILSVQIQRTEICLWAMVNPSDGKISRRIFMAATGHEIRHETAFAPHIGTAQQGDFVWHFFDGGER